MKKVLLSLISLLIVASSYAQDCSELFISAMVEGYGNNRALELYNPTNAAIDLSGYSVGRFSNGSVQFTGIQLPADMIQPYSNYTIVIDKRDSLGTGFETPVWNGYQLYDTCRDALTGMPIMDSLGNTIFCVQYDANGLHLYGNVYHDFLDLEGRGDTFLCPVYNVNNAMYFNGNDAIALISGTSISTSGDNIIDVIGVIGENPGDTWQTPWGQWITKDKTIVRNSDVKKGTGPVAGALGDTLDYTQWQIYSKNTFTVLDGQHDCECDPNFVSTTSIETIPFQLFPNPTDGAFTIKADLGVEGIEVYNMVGQVIYNEKINNATQQVDITLPVVNTGIYVVKVNFTDGRSAVKKVMKQ